MHLRIFALIISVLVFQNILAQDYTTRKTTTEKALQFYKTGYSHFRANKLAKALVHFDKALKEDAIFPIKKTELISHQGWKIIDQTSKKRIRVSDLLRKLPKKTYYGIEEIIQELEADNFE